MKNLQLSPARLGLLLRNDLQKFYKPVLYASLAAIGYIIIEYFAQVSDFLNQDGGTRIHHNETFGIILMLGGFVFSSFSFYELHQKERGISFLMIPASQLEKWLSRFILTSGVFTLFIWLLYGLSTIIIGAITHSVWELPLTHFEWFGGDTLLILRLYLVLQSIFIAGSLFFGRLSILLTPISLGALALLLFLLATGYARVLTIGITEGWDLSPKGDYRNSTDFMNTVNFVLKPILQQIFWWTLAPFFWVVSYFRLTETEK
ncbi:MAG: hypothetical protein AAF927_16525 [Bacteroidota bacterium]